MVPTPAHHIFIIYFYYSYFKLSLIYFGILIINLNDGSLQYNLGILREL